MVNCFLFWKFLSLSFGRNRNLENLRTRRFLPKSKSVTLEVFENLRIFQNFTKFLSFFYEFSFFCEKFCFSQHAMSNNLIFSVENHKMMAWITEWWFRTRAESSWWSSTLAAAVWLEIAAMNTRFEYIYPRVLHVEHMDTKVQWRWSIDPMHLWTHVLPMCTT